MVTQFEDVLELAVKLADRDSELTPSTAFLLAMLQRAQATGQLKMSTKKNEDGTFTHTFEFESTADFSSRNT